MNSLLVCIHRHSLSQMCTRALLHIGGGESHTMASSGEEEEEEMEEGKQAESEQQPSGEDGMSEKVGSNMCVCESLS